MRLGPDWDDAAEGRSRALRRMPRHWRLDTSESAHEVARRVVWRVIKFSAIFAILLVAYVAVAKEIGVL